MITVAVIADDFTGANATGVQMAKSRLRVSTIVNYHNLENLNEIEDCDCIVYPTNSRSIDGDEAYQRVYNAAKKIKNPSIQLYGKRIDTVLRGNVGKETDAILDALGEDTVALVVPCYPYAGRINVGGRIIVNSIPLHKSEVATDPKNPINTSSCAEIFRRQSKYPIASVFIEDLSNEANHLANIIVKLKEQGIRIIIFDAITDEDLDLIAKAAIDSKIKFVAVDPGVFTGAICRQLIAPPVQKQQNKVLVVVGSVNAVAAGQVFNFLQNHQPHNVFMDVDAFVKNEESRQTEINRIVREALSDCTQQGQRQQVVSIVGSGIYPQNRIDFKKYEKSLGLDIEAISNIINESIAEVAFKILSANKDFNGLYTSGGDISISICKRLGAYGMQLYREVQPLASFGELKGGPFRGLKYITKGGMVGDENALSTCIDYLKGAIQ